MIAKASTSTRPKLRWKPAEIAEYLPGVPVLGRKTAGGAGFRSRMGRRIAGKPPSLAAIKRAVWQSSAGRETQRSRLIWGETLIADGANGSPTTQAGVPAPLKKTRTSDRGRLQRAGPTRARLLVVAQAGDHVVQLFEGDEPAAVPQLVLVDGHRHFVDFLTRRIVRVGELAASAPSLHGVAGVPRRSTKGAGFCSSPCSIYDTPKRDRATAPRHAFNPIDPANASSICRQAVVKI